MAEALSPPPPPSASPSLTTTTSNEGHVPKPLTSPRPRDQQTQQRIPSYAHNRMSAYSRNSRYSSNGSRPNSHVFSSSHIPSSLPYTLVRDFAYPAYHPMHFGPQQEMGGNSGATTPGSTSEAWGHGGGRRASDAGAESSSSSLLQRYGDERLSAGPWGGDGAIYGEDGHHTREAGMMAGAEGEGTLPSTSFGGDEAGGVGEYVGDGTVGSRRMSRPGQGRHRKSKSYADITDFERGRRKESGGGGGRGGEDMFYFSGAGPGQQQQHYSYQNQTHQQQQYSDPAGRESLRQSRGYHNHGAAAGSNAENGGPRRDSRYNDTTLPSRSFHTSQLLVDTESDLPLDSEYTTHSPQRESLGPEDEELFAGPSLALYNFEPENPNELRLLEGQTILVSYRHGQGWLVAEDPQTGEQGLVPEEYVRLLRDIEGWDEEKGRFIEDDEEEDDDDEDEEEEDRDGGMHQQHDAMSQLAQHTGHLRIMDEHAHRSVNQT